MLNGDRLTVIRGFEDFQPVDSNDVRNVGEECPTLQNNDGCAALPRSTMRDLASLVGFNVSAFSSE